MNEWTAATTATTATKTHAKPSATMQKANENSHCLNCSNLTVAAIVVAVVAALVAAMFYVAAFTLYEVEPRC